MEDASDEVLIAKIAKSDRLAMAALFARYRLRVYRFVLRMVRNATIAEDLNSDVFLEIWRQAGTFEGRAAVSTWIFSIARYKALDTSRKRKALTEHDLPPNPEPSPEAKAMQASSSDYMRTCMMALSQEHREIIDLVYFHEKSVKEVSEILNIPEATVMTRMFYARKKLKEMLQTEGDQRDVFSYGK